MGTWIKTLALLVQLAAAYGQVFTATRLRTEYRAVPLNIESPAPRFSWAVSHPTRGEVQASADLAVYAGNAAGPLQWRTTVPGGWSLNVPYGGPPLAADATYVWSVTLRDSRHNASAPAWASFSTALPDEPAWRGAAWVGGAGTGLAADGLLRAEFHVPPAAGAVLRARLHVAGLGAYHAFLGGQPTDDHQLHAFTTFQRRLSYDTHDVTSLVAPGCNALGLLLTKGWCAQTRLNDTVRNIAACDRTGARVLLSVATASGGTLYYASGTASLPFASAASPVVASDIYDGETYDARLEQDGWAVCGFANGSAWAPATVLPGPPLSNASRWRPALVAAAHTTRVDREIPPSAVVR
jgi:alpha-L-rhamnosidase